MVHKPKKLRIHCADDNRDRIARFTTLLAESEYCVTKTYRGNRAWQNVAAYNSQGDVVITYDRMPGFHGSAMVGFLRKEGALGEIRVCSSVFAVIEGWTLLKLGAGRVLAKGYSPDTLLEYLSALTTAEFRPSATTVSHAARPF